MIQGRIEGSRPTLIDRILPENYDLSGGLGTQAEAFAAVYTYPTPLGS
jgi:hypothetical protein